MGAQLQPLGGAAKEAEPAHTDPALPEHSFSLSEAGRTIEGRWEISTDGGPWELDFHLTYTKLD